MTLLGEMVERYAGYVAESHGRDDINDQDRATAHRLLEQLNADGRLTPLDGMPRFTMLAKDDVAPAVISFYIDQCRAVGWYEQADQVELALDELEGWRAAHPELCKMPDHPHVPTPVLRNPHRTEIVER
jgi:hypothetical protein